VLRSKTRAAHERTECLGSRAESARWARPVCSASRQLSHCMTRRAERSSRCGSRGRARDRAARERQRRPPGERTGLSRHALLAAAAHHSGDPRRLHRARDALRELSIVLLIGIVEKDAILIVDLRGVRAALPTDPHDHNRRAARRRSIGSRGLRRSRSPASVEQRKVARDPSAVRTVRPPSGKEPTW